MELVPGSGAVADGDVYRLLRRRLRVVCTMLAGLFLAMVGLSFVFTLAGFPPELAARLAGRPGIDVHALLALVDRGCPPELAARILAPVPLPGEPGTVGVAGHRTTYGAWFRHIDRLRPGDAVQMTMPYGRFTYRVERTRIVAPTALWVTRPVAYDRIILSACNPLYSAAQRIVVFARLVGAVPRGAAA